jgi:hypothetical protein
VFRRLLHDAPYGLDDERRSVVLNVVSLLGSRGNVQLHAARVDETIVGRKRQGAAARSASIVTPPRER